MQAGAGHSAFEQRMTKRGFDPMVIIGIISAILPLIQGCFKPTPASLKRRANLPLVSQALREKDPTLGFIESRRRGRDVLSVLQEAPDEEVQAFIDDCTPRSDDMAPVATTIE